MAVSSTLYAASATLPGCLAGDLRPGAPCLDRCQRAIGFLGAAPESDGVVRSLDANKPVFDRARFAVDLSASYGFRLFRDRVRAKVQLNVRDVLENGRLQKVAINPDGSTYAFRIIDPRQIILSTSFDL